MVLCERKSFQLGICRSQTCNASGKDTPGLCVTLRNPLRPQRLNFKLPGIQQIFNAEDAEAFAKARRGLRAKRVSSPVSARIRRAGMLCVKQQLRETNFTQRCQDAKWEQRLFLRRGLIAGYLALLIVPDGVRFTDGELK